MNRSRTVLVLSFLLLLSLGLWAQNRHQGTRVTSDPGTCHFVDENGDGINDLCLDHDGDGVPNRLDPDWQRPMDGSGRKGSGSRGWRVLSGQGRSIGTPGFRRGLHTQDGTCDGTGRRPGRRGA